MVCERDWFVGAMKEWFEVGVDVVVRGVRVFGSSISGLTRHGFVTDLVGA